MLSNQKDSVVVYLDAPPISRSIHQLTDYSSYLIYSLCAMPLVRLHPTENSIQPLAAKSWNITENYSVYEFILHDNLYWANGEKVNPMDYYSAINFILTDKTSRFRSMLIDVIGYNEIITGATDILSGMECDKNIIRFRLGKPNVFFPMCLSLPIFSPLHKSEQKLFCGAYSITETTNYNVELTRNKYFELDKHNKPINTIKFTHQVDASDPFALDAFKQGTIDVTSDTSFPYDKYAQYAHQKSIIQEYHVDISCILSENKNVSPDLTKLIIHGINRENIVKKLHGIPEISCSYHHLFDRKNSSDIDYLYSKEIALEYSSKIDSSMEITIAYEDFYPNLEILSLIEEQLREFGVRFKFLVEEYGARNISSHYRLELRKSPIPDPLFFYKNASKSKRLLTNKEQMSLFGGLLNKYQEIQNESERLFIAMEMDSILIQLGQYVPILKIPGIYLKNPIIKNATLFMPGQIWHV